MTARWVALLRGINVGGKNLVPMADLRACFEAQGFGEVSTYIASGNVLFSSAERSRGKLVAGIEAALARRFGQPLSVVLRSGAEMQAVVDGAPAGFGTRPAEHRYDVIYLRQPLTAAAALAVIPRRAGVDEAWAGRGVIYYARLEREVAKSQIGRLVTLPIYKQMTLRNWNTATRLAALLSRRAPA